MLGLIIAVPVILIIPDLNSKYKVVLVSQEPAHSPNEYRVFFHDLNNDGHPQRINTIRNNYGQLAIQYYKDKGGMVNQINFPDEYSSRLPNLYFGDADQNGFAEIYGFTLKGDSLMLNSAEPFYKSNNRYSCHFITRVGTFKNGNINISIDRFLVTDMDKDGKNELVFSVVAGYSKFPRQIFRVDPESYLVTATPDMGIEPYNYIVYDLNQDGKMEILAGSSAAGNLSDSLGNLMIDDQPYLIGFDCGMKPIFNPVPFSSGIPNNIQVFVSNGELVIFQFNKSLEPEEIAKVFRADFTGVLKDSVGFPDMGKDFAFRAFDTGNNFLIYAGNRIEFLNKKAELIKTREIESSSRIYANTETKKGAPDYITADLHLKRVVAYTEEFGHNAAVNFTNETIKDIVFNAGRGAEYFLILTDNNEYTYRFSENPLYPLKYLIYALVYLLSVLFIWLIQRIREKQLKAWFDIQNQLRNMEIKYLRMQMDPHFMFNAFNSMALLMKNGKSEDAYEPFIKFTKMIRSNFDFSERITRTLNEELQMVTHYLDINKLRFKEKLDSRITVAPDVPLNMLIPRMMLQIHVENALKHGLSKLEDIGILNVDIVREDQGICITIEDNGVGRLKAAVSNTDSTRQGLKMLQAIYDRLNQQNKIRIIQHFIDLADDAGLPAGTRVVIHIPVNLKEDPGAGLS